MKVVIFYEHAQRELQNAYLLKVELTKRGHDVYIYNRTHMIKTNQMVDFSPDLVLVPHLYHEPSLKLITSRFNEKIKRIVNLQYEQVLSKLWEDTGHHNPKGMAKNAMHLCWGKKSRDRLISKGIPKENVIISGCLNIDMDLERFKSIYRSKQYMAKKYNLFQDKKWILFISSFSLASNIEKERLVLLGQDKANHIININKDSRKIILGWIEKYLENNDDCEFIYRPHPSEDKAIELTNLQKRIKNFHLIENDSVRSWIKVCDKINTWISTSIIDAYFMNKECSVLRPVEVPSYFDIPIISDKEYIISYESFYNYNESINQGSEFPIDKNLILEYYDVDSNKYAYERICDLLEDIVKKDINMKLY